MAVGAASPALGHAAAVGDDGGDGEDDNTPSEVASKEAEPAPAEGVRGIGLEGRGAAPPPELVPVKVGVESEKEEVAGDEEEEKWLNLYSSMHSILTVGDGDFSFSLSLASKFGSGAFIVATSLDAYVVLKGKYNDAESNIMELKRLETTVLHGVDVTTMKLHTDLKNRRFDRIVFNFPHAGFHGPEDQVKMIDLHKKLLRGFFSNACYLLMPYGEIHVRHKTGGPYDKWDLQQLASDSSLIMFEKEIFQIADYPGYNQKRGDGRRCDQPFNIGPSCTFKFRIGDLKKQKKLSGNKARSVSSLGGSNVHPPGNLQTDTRSFQPLPLQAWPWLHFTPPVNTVRMPIPLNPYIASQRQQPGLPPKLDGIVSAPLHRQPMFSFAGPWLNELHAPGGIPPFLSRTAFLNLLALLNQPYYQQRNVAGPPGGGLQREAEVQRNCMMPGAAGLSYSSAFLEQRHRESVQKGLKAMMMPGADGLSYSAAFLEQCYRERLNSMITYGCQ